MNKIDIAKKLPVIGCKNNKCFTLDLGGYLLNVEIESVSYGPLKTDEIIIKCNAIDV